MHFAFIVIYLWSDSLELHHHIQSLWGEVKSVFQLEETLPVLQGCIHLGMFYSSVVGPQRWSFSLWPWRCSPHADTHTHTCPCVDKASANEKKEIKTIFTWMLGLKNQFSYQVSLVFAWIKIDKRSKSMQKSMHVIALFMLSLHSILSTKPF